MSPSARHTLLPLDDCLYARLQATIPHLTRSSLHRCLQRHGISRLPEVEGAKPARRSSKLSDRLFPYRYRRGPDRRGQALPLCRHRPHQQIRLRAIGEKDRKDVCGGVPRGPDRGRPVQDPHSAHRQWHPVHRSADVTRRARRRDIMTHHVRHALPGERHRASAHQNQASLDQWPGRTHEPHDQGSDSQTLSLRRHEQLEAHLAASSTPTIMAGGSRP